MGAGRATGEGRDRFRGVENVEGSKHDDVIVGNKKKNLLNGAAGSDRLKGRGGADLFIGRTGNDKMTGGKGTDLATFFFSNGVDGDLAQGVVTGEGRDTLRSIENLEGSNKAPDRLVGNGGKNALLGETGRDTLNGGGGEDFIDGGAGNDHRLIGGGGNDFIIGGKGNDRMGAVSDAGAEDGSDFIRGEDGDDRLFGGGDGDLLEGGRGDDHFDGGDGFDFATFTFAPDRIVADLTANTATGWGNDTFAANPLPTVEGLQGTDKNDHLVGSSLGNSLYGGKGDDELEALEDNDLLVGGDGDDDLDGGLGIDECRAGETETSCELPLPLPNSAVRSAEVTRVTQPTISDMAPQVSAGLSTGTVTSGELPFTP
jgi:Ca2+-binding RTX toxin-like protein